MLSLGIWPQPDEPSQINFFFKTKVNWIFIRRRWAKRRDRSVYSPVFPLSSSFFRALFKNWPAYKRVWFYILLSPLHSFTQNSCPKLTDRSDCFSSVHQSTALAIQVRPVMIERLRLWSYSELHGWKAKSLHHSRTVSHEGRSTTRWLPQLLAALRAVPPAFCSATRTLCLHTTSSSPT